MRTLAAALVRLVRAHLPRDPDGWESRPDPGDDGWCGNGL
jgi:hypothetical protein